MKNQIGIYLLTRNYTPKTAETEFRHYFQDGVFGTDPRGRLGDGPALTASRQLQHTATPREIALSEYFGDPAFADDRTLAAHGAVLFEVGGRILVATVGTAHHISSYMTVEDNFGLVALANERPADIEEIVSEALHASRSRTGQWIRNPRSLREFVVLDHTDIFVRLSARANESVGRAFGTDAYRTQLELGPDTFSRARKLLEFWQDGYIENETLRMSIGCCPVEKADTTALESRFLAALKNGEANLLAIVPPSDEDTWVVYRSFGRGAAPIEQPATEDAILFYALQSAERGEDPNQYSLKDTAQVPPRSIPLLEAIEWHFKDDAGIEYYRADGRWYRVSQERARREREALKQTIDASQRYLQAVLPLPTFASTDTSLTAKGKVNLDENAYTNRIAPLLPHGRCLDEASMRPSHERSTFEFADLHFTANGTSGWLHLKRGTGISTIGLLAEQASASIYLVEDPTRCEGLSVRLSLRAEATLKVTTDRNQYYGLAIISRDITALHASLGIRAVMALNKAVKDIERFFIPIIIGVQDVSESSARAAS